MSEKTVHPQPSGDLHMRSFEEVRILWERMSGEKLTRQRITQIHWSAVEKVREALLPIAADHFGWNDQ